MPAPEIPAAAIGTWDELYDELAAGDTAVDSAIRTGLTRTPTRSGALAYLKIRIKSEQRSYDLWKGLLLGVGAFALVTLAVLIVQWVVQPDITALATGAGLIFESVAAVFIGNRTAEAKKSLNAAINAYIRAEAA